MIAVEGAQYGRSILTALRWPAGFAVVLALHVGVLFVLLQGPMPPLTSSVPAPDAIMLDLASEPAQPASVEPQPEPAVPLHELIPEPAPEPQSPFDPPSSPPVPVPEPPPSVAPPTPLTPEPAVAIPAPPPPPPRATVKRHVVQPPVVHQPPKSAPVRTAEQSPTPDSVPTAAPAAAASTTSHSDAMPNWRAQLIERLQRSKRYPDAARARDEQGVATTTLTMDRNGHVLSIKLVHTSGSQILDEEAVDMIRRADPLPPLPNEVAGNTVTLTVPVTFSLR